ncbi:MAG: hypothetical protein RJA07_995 [Bacteroidota bacterium]|jgi:predicted extracellular nuclease
MNKFCLAIFLVLASVVNIKAQNKKQISIAFYNCENFFDTINDPNVKDEEFLPDAKSHWTIGRFNTKKQHIAQVISSINNDGADMMGLCEIENKYVLEQLIQESSLAKSNYEIVHYNSADERGIDVAFLYKKEAIKLLGSKSYRLRFPFDSTLKTRDILIVNVEFLNGQQAFIAVNHFPSRRGGTDESDQKRIYVAHTERHILDSTFAANKSINPILIAMGDFNDEPENKSLQTMESSSIMPMENVFKSFKTEKLGTHYYKGEWSMFDQFFVSKNCVDGKKTKATFSKGNAHIFKSDFLLEQTPGLYFGAPLRTYAGTRYFGGYSDHLPVYILLDLK